MKECSKCLNILPLSSFEKRKEGIDGVRGQCKQCRNEKRKEYPKSDVTIENNKALHKEYYKKDSFKLKKKAQAKKSKIQRRYNITVEEYDNIMEKNTECRICGKASNLVYDHDHITMKFRGVLCSSCNLGLGLLGDTEEGLSKAYKYLKGNK